MQTFLVNLNILKNGVENESGLKSDEKRHVKLVRNDDNMRRYNRVYYICCVPLLYF